MDDKCIGAYVAIIPPTLDHKVDMKDKEAAGVESSIHDQTSSVSSLNDKALC